MFTDYIHLTSFMKVTLNDMSVKCEGAKVKCIHWQKFDFSSWEMNESTALSAKWYFENHGRLHYEGYNVLNNHASRRIETWSSWCTRIVQFPKCEGGVVDWSAATNFCKFFLSSFLFNKYCSLWLGDPWPLFVRICLELMF